MEKWKRIHPWITAVLLLAVVTVAMISCIEIYQSGSRPFTPEVIGQYALQFGWLGILTAAAVVAGLLIPSFRPKTKGLRDLKDQLARYPATLPEIQKEQKTCRALRLGLYIAIAALTIYPAAYLCNGDNFGVADINGAVLKASLVLLVPTAAGMGLSLLVRHLEMNSIRRQIEILKAAGIKPSEPVHKEAASKGLTAIRAAVLAAALVMIVVGAINGGAADVLGKAIRICTECIGLG